MLSSIDPTTLFGGAGAASLALYIIWCDKKDKRELQKLLRACQKDNLNITVEATSVLKDMERTIQKQNDNHDRIETVLQQILNRL